MEKLTIVKNVAYSQDVQFEIEDWEESNPKFKVRKSYFEPIKNSTKFNLVIEAEEQLANGYYDQHDKTLSKIQENGGH